MYDYYQIMNRLRKLSLRAREAWAAVMVQSVLEYYSPYFRTTFLQNACISEAWRFVDNNEISIDGISSLVEAVGRLISQAESEGYTLREPAMGIELLSELKSRDGRSAFVAVENAGSSFARQVLYKTGTTAEDSRLSTEMFDAIQVPFWEEAMKILAHIESLRDDAIAGERFRLIAFEFPRVELGNFSQERLSPPIHERANI